MKPEHAALTSNAGQPLAPRRCCNRQAVDGKIRSGVVVTVDKHGNTSSGSVPLALDAAVREGKIQRGQLVLLEAFGGGFTWGSALLRY